MWLEPYGTGANITVSPARKATAPVLVIAVNIGRAASGSAPLINERRNELDAIALAACGRYAVVRNTKDDLTNIEI